MYSVGLDIGGSWVRAAIGTREGAILKREAERVSSESGESFIKQIEGLVLRVCDGDLSKVSGIGIGAAGRLDMRKGIVGFSPHTGIRDVPLVEALEESLGKEVILLNDCVAAALAEKIIGAGKGTDDIVYVGIGTGIGGGIVSGGELLLGKDGNAHEIGHMTIDLEGRLACNCGGRGHWEAYTSGSALPIYSRLLAGGYDGVETPLLGRLGSVASSKEIFEAHRSGDAFAKYVLDKAAGINAIGFSNLANLYDPSIITVGGGLALKNVEEVIRPIDQLLPSLSFNRPPKVLPTPLGEDAPLLGAVVSVFELGALT